jgi:hypothetical protein
MDPIDASRICNSFYGCDWDPRVSTQYSGINVYVRGNPGTKFHLVYTISGNLAASITTTNGCGYPYNTQNARASAAWLGDAEHGDPVVLATTEQGTGGFCGIPPPKSGTADVSVSHVIDGTSAGDTIMHNGQTYSYAHGIPPF